jgi:type IV secretory pathway TrbD component
MVLLVVADVLLALTFAVVLSLALESKAGVVLWLVVVSAAALVVTRHVQFARSGGRGRSPARRPG